MTSPGARQQLSRPLAAIAIVVVLALCGHLGFVAWLSHAIADAPNAGRRIGAIHAVSGAELAGLHAGRQLRVPVGPPAASLSLWIIDPRQSPRGTVLVLHGIRDQKGTMLGMGRLLSEHGFRAVLIDLRGHGQSTGDWLSYGIVESRDLRQAVDALELRGFLPGGLGVYGPSYGGAVALQLAALDPRVRAVVAVATFASARQAVEDYIRGTAPHWLVPEATINQAFRRASRLAGVRLENARPVDAIASTRAACLLLAGQADRLLPPRHARALASAAAGPVRLVLLENEGHDSIFADRTGTLRRETLAWFERWLVGSFAPKKAL